MRILVTGGAGFIGSNYVRRLTDGTLKGASEVIVLDKLTYAGNIENLSSIPTDRFIFVHADIGDYSVVAKLVKQVDCVVNFAAESHVDRSIENPGSFVDTNVKGMQVLLDVLREHEEKRLLQVSTDEVYGSIAEGSWNESCPVLPNSPYSASKAASDLMSRAHFITYGMDVVITRSSNNYGPFQHREKLIPVIITKLLMEQKIPVYGDGTNVRDWLHVDDNCRAIHEVLLNGKAGEIYNIGGGNELSNIELIRKILSILGKEEKEYIQFVPDRKGHDFRYSVDTKKIQEEIKFNPRIELQSGLKETIKWYESNRDWWMGAEF